VRSEVSWRRLLVACSSKRGRPFARGAGRGGRQHRQATRRDRYGGRVNQHLAGLASWWSLL